MYAGNYIYKNDQLQYFSTPEGYVTPTSAPSGAEGYRYVYNYKDHLGNVRLSYTKNDAGNLEVIEESNYYPFGLTHKGYNSAVSSLGNSTAQLLKFGGKEEQNELGLGWIDITARNYDPALGRWMNLDPLTEQMRRHSPYNYAFDNPIFFMDPDGMAPMGPLDDIYLDRNGKEIFRVEKEGPDRTFVVRTSKKTNNSAESGLANTNPISKSDAKNAEKQIKSGNLEGDHMDNLVQIENASTQQQMLNVANRDDGSSPVVKIENDEITNPESFTSNNFKEHGGNIENGQVTNATSGGISIPGMGNGKVTIDGGVDFHTHPSGKATITDANGNVTNHETHQFPSADDITNARRTGKMKYQIGTRSKKVNIYDGTGVISIIPTKNFGNQQ